MTSPERIAIVGARAHPNLEMVREYVRSLPTDVLVISGGADGVDAAAEAEVERLGSPLVSFRVRKTSTGAQVVMLKGEQGSDAYRYRQNYLLGLPHDLSFRDALIYRNTLIVLGCTRLVAFPDGSRGGTSDSIQQAQRFRRPYEVIRLEDF